MTTQHEEWRTIDGFAGYSVSSLGRIRSHARDVRGVGGCARRIGGRLLSARGSPAARYAFVTLCRDGHVEQHYVHALVLAAFVGPRPTGHQASHIDGDCRNNRASNLAWESPYDNTRRKHAHGTAPVGEKHPSARVTEEDVLAIRARAASGPHGTKRRLARQYGLTDSGVGDIIHRRTWKHV